MFGCGSTTAVAKPATAVTTKQIDRIVSVAILFIDRFYGHSVLCCALAFSCKTEQMYWKSCFFCTHSLFMRTTRISFKWKEITMMMYCMHLRERKLLKHATSMIFKYVSPLIMVLSVVFHLRWVFFHFLSLKSIDSSAQYSSFKCMFPELNAITLKRLFCCFFSADWIFQMHYRYVRPVLTVLRSRYRRYDACIASGSPTIDISLVALHLSIGFFSLSLESSFVLSLSRFNGNWFNYPLSIELVVKVTFASNLLSPKGSQQLNPVIPPGYTQRCRWACTQWIYLSVYPYIIVSRR